MKDVLYRGLEDSEIEMDLLGDKNQDMTVEQVLGFVEAKESGKRSASRLLLPQATDAVGGRSYRKQKKTPPKGTHQDTCTYCGTKGHGQNSPTRIRRKECPAFGTKCDYCGKDHHLQKVCRAKQHPKSAKNTEHEDVISDVLCEVTSTDAPAWLIKSIKRTWLTKSIKRTSLAHHVFDNVTKEWLRRRSKSQPYIQLQMSTQREDYNHFGFPLRAPQARSFVSAMDDTGCQSCLAGLKVAKKLGSSPLTLRCTQRTITTFAFLVPPYFGSQGRTTREENIPPDK